MFLNPYNVPQNMLGTGPAPQNHGLTYKCKTHESLP